MEAAAVVGAGDFGVAGGHFRNVMEKTPPASFAAWMSPRMLPSCTGLSFMAVACRAAFCHCDNVATVPQCLCAVCTESVCAMYDNGCAVLRRAGGGSQGLRDGRWHKRYAEPSGGRSTSLPTRTNAEIGCLCIRGGLAHDTVNPANAEHLRRLELHRHNLGLRRTYEDELKYTRCADRRSGRISEDLPRISPPSGIGKIRRKFGENLGNSRKSAGPMRRSR